MAIEDSLQVTTLNQSYGPGGYTIGVSGTNTSVVQSYTRGTLILDVLSNEFRRLVWRGSAEAQVDLSSSSEEKEKLINDAARDMIRSFPPS